MEVPDPTGRLKPGMFGRFNIVWDAREDTLLIPRVAVLDEETEQSVFVVEDGVAQRRTVRLGYPKGGSIEVVDGLTGNEEIVVIGQTGLKDGAKVEVIRRGPAAAEPPAEAPPATDS